jgi:mannitol-1-phosphate/altronate dehydrogenase
MAQPISTHHDDDMKPKAIHFGAGNIGRGFIAPLLSGSGYTVVFADVDKHLIDMLNEEHHYDVHVLDQETRTFAVQDVMGVLSTTEDIVRAIADPNAHVVTTAVGVNILDRIAPTIAKGLVRRREIGGDVMNVVACEVSTVRIPSSVYPCSLTLRQPEHYWRHISLEGAGLISSPYFSRQSLGY